MKKMFKLLSLLSVAVIVATVGLTSFVRAADTTVNMSITAGAITYGAPTAFTFTTPLNASFSAQTEQEVFSGAANYFWVQDLKGTNSGYVTTLQLSGNMTAGSNIISWSNVSFRAFGWINVISWSANPRVVLDAGTSWYQALNTARNFIRRNNAANSWVIGYYGANIDLKIDIPAWQPAGAYTGTLVYTLIEN
jgi:hypothetical protein